MEERIAGAANPSEKEEIMSRAIRETLRRARDAVRSSLELAMRTQIESLDEAGNSSSDEFSLEETLDAFANRGGKEIESQDLRMEVRKRIPQPICLLIDTSLSMTGEKLALTAVALGVVCLQFPLEKIAIVAFEHEPRTLRSPGETMTAYETLHKFYRSPTQGYTDLEKALRLGVSLLPELSGSEGGSRPPVTLLVSDGKYTAGRNPLDLHLSFPILHVIKMGNDPASDSLCRELASRGKGNLYYSRDIHELPRAMTIAMRDVAKGVRLA